MPLWVTLEEQHPGPGTRGPRTIRCSPPVGTAGAARTWKSGERPPAGYVTTWRVATITPATGLDSVDPRPAAVARRIHAAEERWAGRSDDPAPRVRGEILREAGEAAGPAARRWVTGRIPDRRPDQWDLILGQLALGTTHETGRALTLRRWPGAWTSRTPEERRRKPRTPAARNVRQLLAWRREHGTWPGPTDVTVRQRPRRDGRPAPDDSPR